jgi:hypothetical protein
LNIKISPGEGIDPKSLSFLRVFHIVCLAIIPIAIILLIILFQSDFQPILSNQDSTITMVEIIFGIFSVILLIFGFTMPKFFKWNDRQKISSRDIIMSQIFRVGLFETLTAYGFILGVLGSTWYVVGIFILFAAIAFIATYPTNSRIAKWKI